MTVEKWAELERAVERARTHFEEAVDLARPLLDRVYKLRGNPWDSDNYDRDAQWATEVDACARVAIMLLRQLHAAMPPD